VIKQIPRSKGLVFKQGMGRGHDLAELRAACDRLVAEGVLADELGFLIRLKWRK
jgi:hypothetical protein